jgi:hypothetical protein
MTNPENLVKGEIHDKSNTKEGGTEMAAAERFSVDGSVRKWLVGIRDGCGGDEMAVIR